MRKNPLSNMSANGGIITSEFLEIIRGEKVANPKVQPESFATFNAAAPKNKAELDQWIVDSWDRLRERWDSLSNRYLKMDVSDARSKWMVPLFKELGFDPGFIKEETAVDGDDKLRFRLSHRGWISAGAPMLHMVAPSQDLEEAGEGADGEVVRRGRSRSPHDELQTYLNVTKRSKWGIVTNGVLLRILREYYHTTTKGYVEFDIENIFRERSFTDFRALYRIAQASRFLPDNDGLCPLEQFYKESVAAGVTVGENLRRNVKKAIEALGNGFLTNELTEKMIGDEDFCRAYYSELLRIVYRLLFLLFAEQRAMLPTRDSLYAEEYSITRLREMAETRRGKDDHCDLWEGLRATFQMLKRGCPPLKVFGYNGSLFDDAELAILSQLSCKNEDILDVVRHLTLVEEEHVLKRINYLDLGVSEIGSIYESLLDFTPKVFATEQKIEEEIIAANTFVLDPRGVARKTSGSYYTSPRLIDELIKSALKPVAEDRLSKTAEKEKALLSMKVCDPACGSGAFLIAANNFLARELAKVRTGQAEPSDKEVKKAARDVLQHCIYGVDLNPMATELAKVSLWINSCVEDTPLNFLDHHIKCGNSLIGSTPELLEGGIPDEAFTPVGSDDKNFAKEMKSRNAFERKNKLIVEFEFVDQEKQAKKYALLDEFLEESPEDVEEKKKRYNALKTSPNWQESKLCSDAWTAAFFWPLDRTFNPLTEAMLRLIKARGIKAIEQKIAENIENLAKQHRFFHWQLEFPDVFAGEKNGFDCLLGNPPWERIKIQEKEFFETLDPEIANAPNASKRKELIKTLPERKHRIWTAFLKALTLSENESKFIRFSGRYRLTAKGDINTYSIFAEHAKNSICSNGLSGIILPTGIATDDTNKEFFGKLISSKQLVSLYDFENKEGLFPSVHRSYKFSLVTMGNLNKTAKPTFAFFLQNPEQLKEQEKIFELTEDDFLLLNPNTKTCPIFRSKKDAEITKRIYRSFPVLSNESTGVNPWGVKFLAMFHMANDSQFFKSRAELEKEGFALSGNLIAKEGSKYLPLYEGKMIWIYNHRVGSVDYKGAVVPGRHDVITSEDDQLRDPCFVSSPRFWVNEKEVLTRLPENRSWLVGFRDITNASSERTSIFSIIPLAGVGHQMPLVFFHDVTPRQILAFLANMNSFVLDYVTRQKLGGNHMTYFILRQLPVLSPSQFNKTLLDLVVKKVIELVYTAWDLKGLAIDVKYIESDNYPKPPVQWDCSRRMVLQCELDALFFILYGMSREDTDYIMETFCIVKRKDTESYGEFRTKNLIMQYFDEYSVKLQALAHLQELNT